MRTSRRPLTPLLLSAALSAAALSGCGGGSRAAAAPSRAPLATGGVLGGMVATVDRAQLLGACANVRTAFTEAAAGNDAGAHAALVDAAAQLGVVRDPAVVALQAQLRTAAPATAIAAGQRFCDEHGG